MSIAPPRIRKLSVAVIGDVHLGAKYSHAEELLQYLNSIAPKILVIAGDFIDLSTFRKSNLPPSHLDVVSRVIALANNGTKVYYLTGNHDSDMRQYGDLAIGNLHIRKELQLKLDGHNYYMLHGHELDVAIKYNVSEDSLGGYRHQFARYYERIRARANNFFNSTKKSLVAKSNSKNATVDSHLNAFKRLAARLAYNKGCERVVCAHVILPSLDVLTVKEKQIQFLNAGNWITNLSALEYRFGRWSIKYYDENDYPVMRKRLNIGTTKQPHFPTEDPALFLKQMVERAPRTKA